MCTAITYKTEDFYFGRTFDYDVSYGEEVVITPRNYIFNIKYMPDIKEHYGIIGIAHICDDYPLYYDAMNEKGVCMAALNFVGNAIFRDYDKEKNNVPQYEFIPWILTQCDSVEEAKKLINGINITNTYFNKDLPPASLHWIIADKNECIVVESVKEGIKIYNNPIGVLTNNPTFKEQLFNLNNYMKLSPREPSNDFSNKIDLCNYSRGMGAIGLPGDVSSQSRFVRASFNKLNSVSGNSEKESINQFFHILETVSQIRGCCEIGEDRYEITRYTLCCNASKGIYYYTTYENHQINKINMHNENLEGNRLISYKLICEENIREIN